MFPVKRIIIAEALFFHDRRYVAIHEIDVLPLVQFQCPAYQGAVDYFQTGSGKNTAN